MTYCRLWMTGVVTTLLMCGNAAGADGGREYKVDGRAVLVSDDGGATWEQTLSTYATGGVVSWTSTEPERAFLAADGFIRMTTNGGRIWMHVATLPVELVPLKIMASEMNRQLALLVGEYDLWLRPAQKTIIWRSKNGGISWEEVWRTPAEITDILFDADDARKVWFVTNHPPDAENMLHLSKGEGCSHGGPGGIWYSITGGSRWKHFGYPPGMRGVVRAHISERHTLVVVARLGDEFQVFEIDPTTGRWQREPTYAQDTPETP